MRHTGDQETMVSFFFSGRRPATHKMGNKFHDVGIDPSCEEATPGSIHTWVNDGKIDPGVRPPLLLRYDLLVQHLQRQVEDSASSCGAVGVDRGFTEG